MINVGIFGATSYVAKGLIDEFLKYPNEFHLILLSRDKTDLNNYPNNVEKYYLMEYYFHKYDLIINCVQARNIQSSEVFTVNEEWDNKIIDYLIDHPECLYIYLSSGAIYGTFDNPINAISTSKFYCNDLETKKEEYYGIHKLYLEAKHRCFNHLNIVDLRIFGYFNRYLSTETHYFLAEILKTLQNTTIKLITDYESMWRDYVIPEDLFQLIECIIKKWKNNGYINDWFDVYSKEPVEKFALLREIASQFTFKFEINQQSYYKTTTGKKQWYYSKFPKATNLLEYQPKYSSLEGILKVLKEMFP